MLKLHIPRIEVQCLFSAKYLFAIIYNAIKFEILHANENDFNAPIMREMVLNIFSCL